MREKPEKLLELREGPTVVVLCYPKVLGKREGTPDETDENDYKKDEDDDELV